jgi:hypothetical protein
MTVAVKKPTKKTTLNGTKKVVKKTSPIDEAIAYTRKLKEKGIVLKDFVRK